MESFLLIVRNEEEWLESSLILTTTAPLMSALPRCPDASNGMKRALNEVLCGISLVRCLVTLDHARICKGAYSTGRSSIKREKEAAACVTCCVTWAY